MGEKIDGYRAKLKAMPEDDPLRAVGVAMGNQLQTKHRPADMFAMADGIMHLKQLKSLADAFSKAVNEQLDSRKKELYDNMLSTETQSFSRKGQAFYQTTETWVKAKDELGGRTNPDLKKWLEENELGGIVKQDINYQTLQGTVNEWIAKNPIEVVKHGDLLEGAELLEALGVEQEEYDVLVQQHARIRELCDIGESFTVGMRKA